MSKRNLKLLTFNTWGVPYAADQKSRAAAIAQALTGCDYDIVCLQEIWQRDDLAAILEGARSGGLTYQHYFRSGKLGSGLVTLSRHPIVEANFHRFRSSGRVDTFWHGDFFAGKGVGITRINTPVGALDVYNTHTIAQYSPDDRDEYRPHRAAQHYEVTQFIRQHTRENPLLALGDFNMLEHHIGYRLMTQLLNTTDSWRAQHPDDPGYTYAKANFYNRAKQGLTDERLDYVFIRDGVDRKVTIQNTSMVMQTMSGQDIPFSDHYGVEVEVTVAPSELPVNVMPQPQMVQSVLDELTEVLAIGLMDAEYRRNNLTRRVRTGVNAFLPVSLFGRLLGKTYRRWALLSLSAYTALSWLLSEFSVTDEITQLTAIHDEVQHQLHALNEVVGEA